MEGLTEALIECVKALGGSKQVGPVLWPEKAPDAAQRALLDCLNADRPAHLSPEQVVLILRLSRERGIHSGMHFLCGALSYAPPVPIEPEDERDELMREFVEMGRRMERIGERIQSLSAAPKLRSAA